MAKKEKPRPDGETEEAEVVEEQESTKEESKTKKATEQMSWTPKDIEALIRLGMELLGTNLADKYLTYKKNDAESKRHYFESVSTHNRRIIMCSSYF